MINSIPRHLLFILLLFLQLNATSQVIVRQNVTFKELLKDSRKVKKRILLLCCPVWCTPCKELEMVYFQDSSLAKYLETNYIIGKFDVEKKEGIPIAKKFGILEYPTIVVIDSLGLCYYKYSGITSDPASYLSTLKYYDSAYSKPVPGISNKILLNFPDFYTKYFNERIKKKPDSVLVDQYLLKQDNKKTEVVWRILNLFTYGSQFDTYILENFNEFTALYGTEAYQKANVIIDKFIKKAIAIRNKKDYLYIIEFMEVNNFKEERVLNAKIKYHLEFQDFSPNFATILKSYFDKYDSGLAAICDNLLFKKNIKFIDEVIVEKLLHKISKDTNPIWKLYIGLYEEKMHSLKEALPHYASYLSLVDGDNKSFEKFILLRDKLRDN